MAVAMVGKILEPVAMPTRVGLLHLMHLSTEGLNSDETFKRNKTWKEKICDVQGKEIDFCRSFLFYLNVLEISTVAHIFQGNIPDTSRWNETHQNTQGKILKKELLIKIIADFRHFQAGRTMGTSTGFLFISSGYILYLNLLK